MQRDNRSIFSDDYLYMAFDTFHDHRNGYIFVTNPNGARYDQIVSNNIFLNSNWDGVWRAAGSVDKEGWKAELAIPFKSLSFDPRKDVWGFNISRSISRKVERGRWKSNENEGSDERQRHGAQNATMEMQPKSNQHIPSNKIYE